MPPFELSLFDREKDFDPFYSFIMRNTDYFTEYLETAPSRGDVEAEFLLDVPPGVDIENKEVYVIYQEQNIIGFLDILFNYPDTSACMIGYLVIDQKHRNQGIGQQVYDQAIAYIKVKDIQKVRLSVVEENKSAIKMWNKQGFETVDEVTTEYGVQLMMEVRL
ncbi:GNAT family N-acetyltransferase [Salinicoccus hispanicus]|uniref:GNAT family N-acetyltransferase n=1 Tax=Salinicoccus hispanicus TaxID=157225 RepID=A0A6N8U1E8_9STAP|nr:GNAT family N-acetyltransferase [Salinicoccus hispanicus]MXQ52028.1 GNAT family N-acetyltransferase [Salinicoccus hispanicus]